MRCCVPGCKNDSKNSSKSKGITFHVFPTDPSLRKTWLRILGKEHWNPKERSTVCSNHFKPKDIFKTKNGLNRIRNGAVPCIDGPNPKDMFRSFGVSVFVSNLEDDPQIMVCRSCLATDTKMLPVKKYKLEEAFDSITGLTLQQEDLPQMLCVECACRLQNCVEFKNKSLKAQSVMLNLINEGSTLSVDVIKTIDRISIKLNSSLHTTDVKQNYDFNIEYEEKDDVDNLHTELTIKDESNEIFINDNSIDGQDSDKKENIDLSRYICDNVNNENNENNENNDDNDNHDDNNDNAISDDNYSTEDGLPLTLCKKKVKRKKLVKKRKVKKDAEPKIDRRRKPFLNEDLSQNLFTITDLNVEEQLAEIHKRQESANYKNSVYKCMDCFKGFLDIDTYTSHMVKHTEQCGEYVCSICKTHFKSPHSLRKHITAHHTHRFSCNQCVYVTTHRQTARLHERWHKGTKYKCPHCEDEFVKFTTYMGHIRIKHPSDFVCQLCGYSFVSQKGIDLHKKLKHRLESDQIPEDGPHCELCNIKFVSEEAYSKHVNVSGRHNVTNDRGKRESNKAKRTSKRREKCEGGSQDMSRHYSTQIRKSEGPIPCEQCGLQLEDSRAYHGHFRRMHPDKNRTNYPSMKSPFMCEVCGRMFQSYALLKDHRWTHTGERPFQCESCDKSFRMRQRLVAHRRVHAAAKPRYSCGLCAKNFSTHSNRQRHMFIHTGLKPFKCELCDKTFKHASEKRAHVTYVHLKKPWPKRTRGRKQMRQLSSGEEPAMWPCDKIPDMGDVMTDKGYYHLKI